MNPPLAHDALCALIPHGGAMCLLETVQRWDAQAIHCRATSHTAPNNPLREAGRLGAIAAVEYGAQAMAVHGALLDSDQGPPVRGYIAALREVRLEVARLDDIAAPLEVSAVREMGDGRTLLYRFAIEAAGRSLASGRATVLLLDATAG